MTPAPQPGPPKVGILSGGPSARDAPSRSRGVEEVRGEQAQGKEATVAERRPIVGVVQIEVGAAAVIAGRDVVGKAAEVQFSPAFTEVHRKARLQRGREQSTG